MKTITKIEANRSAAIHRKCRVAAYCRVSTEHDDQMESLGTCLLYTSPSPRD